MKSFICDCTAPIWNVFKLCQIIEQAQPIAKTLFDQDCNVDREEILCLMSDDPASFEYYRNGEIYFFRYDGIEHFYL